MKFILNILFLVTFITLSIVTLLASFNVEQKLFIFVLGIANLIGIYITNPNNSVSF